MLDKQELEILRVEYEGSGEKCRSFCEARGIPFHEFRNSLSRHSSRQKRAGGGDFVEVKARAARPPTTTERYIVTVGNNRTVSIPPGFEAKEVKQLLQIVESC